jgi:hypothetical protein
MNKEYIDKHEAYLLLKNKAETYMLPATKEAYEKAAILIASMKTHEVQPVKSAHWFINPDGFYPQCSNCGYEPPRELIRRNGDAMIFPRYCPECGCKLDLEGD